MEAGLVVIGVHTPEFSFEKERANVERSVRTLTVTYPVAIDSNYRIWQSFKNQYWPAQYLVDSKGRIRYHHFGEGDYGAIERVIQELLRENGATAVASDTTSVAAAGIEAAPDWTDGRSPETYIGYRQAENFASPERVHHDRIQAFSAPAKLPLNHWGLGGSWNVNAESAVLQAVPGTIVLRFHSRDLHLVLAPPKDGRSVRFKVTLDGAAPGDHAGVDTAADGSGEVREPRLYQQEATSDARIARVDMKLEAVVIPVSEADRVKAFYGRLGWRLDADFRFENGFRVVQFTPLGSGCSVQFGTHITSAAPGSAQGLYLVVADIEAACADLVARGVEVSDVFHAATPGAQFQPDGMPGRVNGPAPNHATYSSYATFRDPDGNSWLLQEVTTRLPGRVDPAATSFGSTTGLASALRRAAAAHGMHEKRIGTADPNWPDWYAEYMVAEQAGTGLPT